MKKTELLSTFLCRRASGGRAAKQESADRSPIGGFHSFF